MIELVSQCYLKGNDSMRISFECCANDDSTVFTIRALGLMKYNDFKDHVLNEFLREKYDIDLNDIRNALPEKFI